MKRFMRRNLWGETNPGYLESAGVQSLSHVPLFATPWTVAHQAPLSTEFSRQEYWSGLLFPSPGDLTDPGIEPESSALAGRFFTTEPPGKPLSRLLGGWGGCHFCKASRNIWPLTFTSSFSRQDVLILI